MRVIFIQNPKDQFFGGHPVVTTNTFNLVENQTKTYFGTTSTYKESCVPVRKGKYLRLWSQVVCVQSWSFCHQI